MSNNMSRIWSVLIDLSGTLHIGNEAIPRAVDALRRLRSLSNVQTKFVTNTTKESRHSLHERLAALGFAVKEEEIFTSLSACRRLVRERNLRPLLLLEESALEDFQGIDTAHPNAVVVGLAPSQLNYDRMNEAFRLLMADREAPLIGIHKARYYKRQDGLAIGPGAFVSGLEHAIDKKAIVVGKPEKSFFQAAMASLPLKSDVDRTFMIGDDARDDIQGAAGAGLMGILVRTGKYRQGDELKISSAPYAIVDDFPSAVDLIEKCVTKDEM